MVTKSAGVTVKLAKLEHEDLTDGEPVPVDGGSEAAISGLSLRSAREHPANSVMVYRRDTRTGSLVPKHEAMKVINHPVFSLEPVVDDRPYIVCEVCATMYPPGPDGVPEAAKLRIPVNVRPLVRRVKDATTGEMVEAPDPHDLRVKLEQAWVAHMAGLHRMEARSYVADKLPETQEELRERLRQTMAM